MSKHFEDKTFDWPRLVRIAVIVGVSGVFLLLIGICMVLAMDTENKVLVITGHSWSRTIWYEELKTSTGEGWEVPIGARVTSSETREKKKGVSAIWYTYEFDQWLPAGSKTESARDLNPHWPSRSTGMRVHESGRTESYTVIFVDESDREYGYSTDINTWQTMRIGARYWATVNGLGMIVNIKTSE